MKQNVTNETKRFYADEAAVVQELKKNMALYSQFQSLNADWKQRFLDYCIGKKTLPVTYDPFFKKIFHPDIHPDRLSNLITSLIDVPVKVIRILPSEENMLSGGALLIMDILVELEDGSLANVEVQKVPYLFPGERIACYSSDLILRQYSRVKGSKGHGFKFGDLKKVYTIVIYEKSTQEFHQRSPYYLHRGRVTFDTGLEIQLLQEYYLLALDVFRENTYPRDKSERTAWISFLATDSPARAEELVAEFPWLGEIYQEMEEYLRKPEEVLNMFSEALKIMDQNTVQYMIEQQQDQLKEQRQYLSEQKQQIDLQQQEIDSQKREIDSQKQEIDSQKQEIDSQKRQLLDAQAQIAQNSKEKIRDIITLCRELGSTKEVAIAQLQDKCHLTPEAALHAIEEFGF